MKSVSGEIRLTAGEICLAAGEIRLAAGERYRFYFNWVKDFTFTVVREIVMKKI